MSFFLNAPDALLNGLIYIYNSIFESGNVPQTFKESIIFPLHKKGNINDVKNYRGLSFINCVAKIFINILDSRLSNWTSDRQLISEFQAGFRRGYSTIDNIFNLNAIVRLRLARTGGKLYAFFVDFSAAFDTIDRKSLLFKLSCIGVSTKFLNIFKNYYNGTRAGVWCGDSVTANFETSTGLRQGCSASPLMFTLFINDLPEALGGGCNFGGTRINILLYADDVVLLAPTSTCLQLMIRNLETYCETWNLRVNLEKSKIIVFRNGGKLASSDKWWFNGKRVEVVNSYKYLGVLFTTTLSWQSHFKDKARQAKLAINSVWNNLINNKSVPLSSKIMCFNSVIKSIVSYGAQVWGCFESEFLESVQKLFLKRLFRLPYNTPNYVIYLESGFKKLFFYNMITNLNYLLKVLHFSDNRLPLILAKQIINQNLDWCRQWKMLGEKVGVDVDFGPEAVKSRCLTVVEKLSDVWIGECIGRARTSIHHSQLISLDLGLELGDRSYLTDNADVSFVSWIIKARAELLYLNGKPWSTGNKFCSLCNMGEIETTFHFIALCPILSNLRLTFLHNRVLSEGDFISFLNGRDWRALVNYLKNAWQYRWILIQEFNN